MTQIHLKTHYKCETKGNCDKAHFGLFFNEKIIISNKIKILNFDCNFDKNVIIPNSVTKISFYQNKTKNKIMKICLPNNIMWCNILIFDINFFCGGLKINSFSNKIIDYHIQEIPNINMLKCVVDYECIKKIKKFDNVELLLY